MIDPASSSPKSSPKSFFRIVLFVLIALFIVILCLIGGYFLSQSKEIKNNSEAHVELIESTPTKITGDIVPLSAPDIAPITTEEEAIESNSKNRLELTDKAIDALSKYKNNSSSSNQ